MSLIYLFKIPFLLFKRMVNQKAKLNVFNSIF